jgi:hypothetical protein
VGLFVHVPLVLVSVWLSVVGPLTAGKTVLVGFDGGVDFDFSGASVFSDAPVFSG